MSNTSEKYFDLHTDGIGYVNRARMVPVKRGEFFLAVDITALHGASDDVQKTRFDCRVSGAEAQQVISGLMDAINDKGRLAADGTTIRSKVLCAFRLGDLYVDTFTYEKGDKKGKTGVSLKARLLRLAWVKVDGNMVYEAKAEFLPEDTSDAAIATAQEHRTDDDADVDDYLPEEVQLSKEDPDFEAKKSRLKQQGYTFDRQSMTWRLPAVA